MTATKNTDLTRDLSEGIASGRFAVGTLLPTEFELCEQYGLSRYAVRKALDQLQALGLISRRKNVGTRVEAMRPQAGFTQSIATVEELARFGAEHVRTVQSVHEVVTDLALARQLGCPGGTRWLHIACLRMEGGQQARPICWLDLYIDPAYADLGELVRNAPETLASSLIEERYGRRIARIQQDIEAVLVPRERSESLGTDAGAPALQITRHYLDVADQVFEISVSLHPADRFKFSMELSRTRD
ncbi:GntR family transcriptional regulator [Acidovorax sp. FJL06]|uniref:GntR family transcriptional regulator n=1 Tax=Acidovorax sp. FJL06 TaxID=2153365 RepID=UPI000F586EF0|nr:GntR family transcriptional regulator [Acidovorax sp. FJL06]RQO81707.1 GntR family transcriptional regulator [Acidovorax sp. FJL06]